MPVGSFPFYRGTRPNTNFNRMIVMESTGRDALQRVGAGGQQAIRRRPDVQRQLHAGESRGQRPDVGDVLRRQPALRRAQLPLRAVPTTTMCAVQQRSASSLRRQLPLTSRPTCGDSGSSGILTLESGLPLTPRITGNLQRRDRRQPTRPAHERHRRLVRRAVGRVQHRSPARPQDVRHPRRKGRSGSAAASRFRCSGRSSTCSTAQNYATFSDTAYDVIGTPVYDAATNLLTVNLQPGHRLPGAAQRQHRTSGACATCSSVCGSSGKPHDAGAGCWVPTVHRTAPSTWHLHRHLT